MRLIGIVGGMSAESTIEYYKVLIAEYKKRLGGINSPRLLIDSLNLEVLSRWMKANEWNKVYEEILISTKRLKAAGAEVAIMATNTPHKVFNKLEKNAPLPMISIMDATVRKVKEKGLGCVALLGTIYTMEGSFYQEVFERHGIKIVIPDKKDRLYINDVIWKELTHHILTEESREGYLRVIARLEKAGAEGVILGCTEIPLLIKQEHCGLPIFDTTTIHALAALDFAMQKEYH